MDRARGPGPPPASRNHAERRRERGAGHGGQGQGQRLCHVCQNPGHLARDCPGRNQNGRSGAHNGNGIGNEARMPREVPASRSPARGAEAGVIGNENGPRKPTFGFKRVHGFMTEGLPDEVILSISRSLNDWDQLLSSKLTDDFFVMLLHVLGEKVCVDHTVVSSLQIQIVSRTIGNEKFLEQYQLLIQKMFWDQEGFPLESNGLRHSRNPNQLLVDKSKDHIFKSTYTILSFIIQKLRFTALDYTQKLLPPILGIIATNVALSPTTMGIHNKNFTDLQLQLKELNQKKTIEEKVRNRRLNRYDITRNEEEMLHNMAPPEDFREIPIIPSIEELTNPAEESFLRPNKIRGSYIDANHYLDVQFRLLREDFVSPLKTGVLDYLKNRLDYLAKKKRMPIGNVRLYDEVKISFPGGKDPLVYIVKLDDKLYKKIKWDRSKRLLPGSLLLFSSDNFITAYYGIVNRRDVKLLQSKCTFEINFQGEIPDTTSMEDVNFVMLECEVYFEAYRHTLQILKDIKLENFPLAKFIVNSSSDVGPPAYLESSIYQMNIGNYNFSPLHGAWPTATQLGLDPTQYIAFKACLTKEFAIVQGPPGTGKTFLGLKAAEVFLRNPEIWCEKGKGPILVVCYTNHALDQFLEGIIAMLKRLNPDEDPPVIRVGGRSSSEALDEYNLNRRRIMASRMKIFDINYIRSRNAAMGELRHVESERQQLICELSGFRNLQGIIDLSKLTVSNSLQHLYLPSVLKCINGTWLKLDDGVFSNRSFSPENYLERVFKLKKVNQIPQVKPTPQPLPLARNNPQENEAEDDDDEDYDLEELLANRLVDEPEEIDDSESFPGIENKSRGTAGAADGLSYILTYSIKHCEAMLKMNDKDKSKLGVNPIRVYNILGFFKLLFTNYKAGRLNLPIINKDLILKLENDEDAEHNPVTETWLKNMELPKRWALYFTIIERARLLTMETSAVMNKRLIDAQKNVQSLRRLADGILLEKTKVVGMTTTGAAKNNDLLQMMKSKIVIVEEAAEVLESHVVTCITEHCQHLILIGDHQQLRPSTTVYDLSKKYNLDISLFERMLNNNLNCYKLKVQHRMRPEICALVQDTIYKELENHPCVQDYPVVKGLQKNLFFIDHRYMEKSESDSKSKSNEHEAQFLANLCRHLVLQGYEPSRITVLTTYTGQMFLLKKEIRAFDSCSGVRVTVVDNFQGEENDIILLSLVRSNEQNNIGFLKTDNRICVAISRAKHGLFIIGNMKALTAKSDTWKQIQAKLLRRGEIGQELELVCEIHDTVSKVSQSHHFISKAPEGGCNLICGAILPCTHSCWSACHIQDREHSLYRCRKPCIKSCLNGHPCTSKCFIKCPPCEVKMDKILPCTHVHNLRCKIDPLTYLCNIPVEKEKPCGHKEEMACHKDPKLVKCTVKYSKQLPCGHVKVMECHIDPETVTCKRQVEKKLVPCGHMQLALCHQHPEMIKCDAVVEKVFPYCNHKLEVSCKNRDSPRLYCQEPCRRRLDCGHACRKKCHVLDDPFHVAYECKENCARNCSNEHPCKRKHLCHEGSEQQCKKHCTTRVTKKLACQLHELEMNCNEDEMEIPCTEPCSKQLPVCQHKCTKLCYEPCTPCQTATCGHGQRTRCSEAPLEMNCQELVRPRAFSACGHNDALVPCGIKTTITPDLIAEIYCSKRCGLLFEGQNACGHRCKGTCSECENGKLHKKCDEKCEKVLVCGHVCSFPCSYNCPPCRQKCSMRCEHSECMKPCGDPCTDCNQPCGWNCEHIRCTKLCGQQCNRKPCDEPCPKKLKCGHDCIGFCGEPCPPLCRICNKNELTVFILYGYEEDDDARFVYLEDCGHCIEQNGLEYYMNNKLEEGEITTKTCPRCKQIIRRNRRYGNIIRQTLKDIVRVKEIVFGKEEEIKKDVQELYSELKYGEDNWNLDFLTETKAFITSHLVDKYVHPNGTSTKKLKNVDMHKVQSFKYIVSHCKELIKLCVPGELKGKTEVEFSFKSLARSLLHKLCSRDLPLSSFEMKDFDMEFQRICEYYQLFLRKASPRFTNGHAKAEPLYKRALSILETHTKFTLGMKMELHKILKEIDDSIRSGLGITDFERRQILDAFNLRQGRWFKCPNGHIYIITECGGAMHESKCNECGALIGGGSHTLRTDNALASEMDGATAALWPQ